MWRRLGGSVTGPEEVEDEQALAQTPSFVRTLLLHPPAVPSALNEHSRRWLQQSTNIGTTAGAKVHELE